MHSNFVAHNFKNSLSSAQFFEYLEKENSYFKNIYFDIYTTEKQDFDFSFDNSQFQIIYHNNSIDLKKDIIYYENNNTYNLPISLNISNEDLKLIDNKYIVNGKIINDKLNAKLDEEYKYLGIEERNRIKKKLINHFTNEVKKELLLKENNFFNHSYNPFKDPKDNVILKEDAIQKLDNNTGCKSKNASNFYSFDLSFSKKELDHLDKITVEELEKRGLFITDDLKENIEYYNYYLEQKKELRDIQIKLYTKDVMNEYARCMNREIFKHQDNLPSDRERLKMNKIVLDKFNEWKEDNNFIVEKKNKIKLENIVKNFDGSFTFYDGEVDFNILINEDEIKYIDNELFINEDYYHQDLKPIIDYKINREKFLNSNINYSEYKRRKNIGRKEKIEFFKSNNVYKLIVQLQGGLGNKEVLIENDLAKYNVKEGTLKMNELYFDYEIYKHSLNEAKKREPEIIKQVRSLFLLKKKYQEIDNLLYKTDEKTNKLVQLSKKETNYFNTICRVQANKEYCKRYNLSNPFEFEIKNYKEKVIFKKEEVTIKRESAKAYFVSLVYKDKKMTLWIPKPKDDEPDQKETEFSVIKEILDNKYELEEAKTNLNKEIKNVSKLILPKKKLINDEAIKIKIDKNINILIPKSKFKDITNREIEELIKEAKINYYKEIYKEEYKTLTKKDIIKDLQSKGILINSNPLVSEPIKILDKQKAYTLVQYKKDDKELEFFVSNKYINNNKLQIDKLKFDILINKAEIKYKEDNREINLSELEKEVKEIKKKEEVVETLFIYKKQIEGLNNPVFLTFREEQIKDDKVKNIDYKKELDKAINKGIKEEYGNIKEDIKLEVWKDNGYNVEKRKLTGEDLEYFAKIEDHRYYSKDDIKVIENKDTIEQINKTQNPKILKELEKKLHKTSEGEIIKAGVKKEGDNTHVHIVVSRFDKTSVNPKDKVSMSPNTNDKTQFNKNQFRQNIEEIFDKKFSYDRSYQNSYCYYINKNSNSIDNIIKNYTKGKIKAELLKQSGLYSYTNEVNVIYQAKREILGNIPIPTSIPTNKIQLLLEIVKVGQKIIGLSI